MSAWNPAYKLVGLHTHSGGRLMPVIPTCESMRVWVKPFLLGHNMKKRLKVSFSGGKSSALMAKLIKENCSDEYEIIYTIANTGEEREETLIFADKCDKEWGLNLIWLEAVINPESGEGTRHKVVTFETASRNGEPFEAMIRKYGVPNLTFKPCNRELKLSAMKSYMDSIGWDSYKIAIGIRIDEDRRAKNAEQLGIVYPLKDWWPTDKQDVNSFWENYHFQLGLKEHEGNCKWCFQKSERKHLLAISENPEFYDFPRRMEKEYGFHGSPYYGIPKDGAKPRVIFRKNMSTDDLFAYSNAVGVVPGAKEFTRQISLFDQDQDSGHCSESCEQFEME